MAETYWAEQAPKGWRVRYEGKRGPRTLSVHTTEARAQRAARELNDQIRAEFHQYQRDKALGLHRISLSFKGTSYEMGVYTFEAGGVSFSTYDVDVFAAFVMGEEGLAEVAAKM